MLNKRFENETDADVDLDEEDWSFIDDNALGANTGRAEEEEDALLLEESSGHESLSIPTSVSVASSITHSLAELSDIDSEVGDVNKDEVNLQAESFPVEPPTPISNSDTSIPTNPLELVQQLTNMGFTEERIERALYDLLSSGATDICADSIIGVMEGDFIIIPTPRTAEGKEGDTAPDNTFEAPLNATWNSVESSVKDLGQHLRRRSQNGARALSQSAQELWSNVVEESGRARSSFQTAFEQADEHARDASTQIRFAASSTKDKFCRANEEHKIIEKAASAVVIVGGLALCLGNPRAGLGCVAVAGSALAVNEATKTSPTQANSTYTRDHGLREGLHLD